MPTSSLRLQDLRAINAINYKCRDMGDDASVWWTHFAGRVAGLFGGEFGASGMVTGVRGPRAETLGIGEWGWANGFAQDPWQMSVQAFDSDPSYTLLYRHYYDHLAADDGVCMSRSQLLGDDDWYRSWCWEAVNRPMGIDHYLMCYRRLAGNGGCSVSIIARSAGRRDFTVRERAVLREAQALVTPLVGGPLARFTEPSPAELPRRVRQVLKCLLEGDSDKQVAARLGISGHTVNQYVKHIFAHFGVNSRAELLARWVRRGWGSRAAWADPD